VKQAIEQHSLRIFAARTYFGTVRVHMLCNLLGSGKQAIAQEIEFVEVTREQEGGDFPPAFTLPMDAAQQLIDELWKAGLRPTEGAGSAGQLASTERHLSDMRMIALHKLGIADK
jgi:hypothetical protein